MLSAVLTSLALALLGAEPRITPHGAPVAKNEPIPVRLALPGFHHGALPVSVADFYANHLTQELNSAGVRVVTLEDMLGLLTVEQQNELLGCWDTSPGCRAELANALGVDGLVNASLQEKDGGYQWDIEVLATHEPEPFGQRSVHVDSDKGLLDELSTSAELVARAMLEKLHRAPVKARLEPAQLTAKRKLYAEQSNAKSLARIPITAGLVIGLTGVVLTILSRGNYDAIAGAGSTSSQGTGASLAAARSNASTGTAEQVAGIACISAGGAALGVGIGVYLAAKPAATQVRLVPTGNGLALSGAF